MKHFLNITFIFIILLLAACHHAANNSNDNILARVHDVYLYQSQLTAAIPTNISPTDSLTLTKDYIDNWIKQQLLLHQAESNLSQKEKDFTSELENYRNSLVIYQYESRLIRQMLDTNISYQEIEDYFNQHNSNFQLKDDIVRINYVILDNSSDQKNKIQHLLRSEKPEAIDALEMLCDSIHADYYLDPQQWHYFSHISRTIPIRTFNPESYLKLNQYTEINDSLKTYMVHFIDYRLKESISPLSLQENNIRNIIINKRKLHLIKEMETEIFESALSKKDFETY